MLKTSKFLEVEKKYDLYNEEIDGVAFWVYSRFWIWENCIRAANMGIKISERTHHINKRDFMNTAVELGKAYLFQGTARARNVDVCFLVHERRFWDGTTYNCMYTEMLSDEFTNSILLERPYQYKHFKPVKVKNYVYTDKASINGKLRSIVYKKVLKNRYSGLLDIISSKMEHPLKEISEAYNVSIDKNKVSELIAENILSYKSKYKYFEKVLKRANPKVIVEVVHYGMSNMIVNEIAKQLGITTIELQHGQIADWHIAYNYAECEAVPQLPDKIFLFSSFWKDNVHLPIDNENLVAVGYPYFEMMKLKYQNSERKPGTTILFISQTEIGKELSRIAVELAAKLEGHGSCSIIYKLHPSEYAGWKDNYPHLAIKNDSITVVDNSLHNLYEYFAISDVQVGVCSTGLYEGFGFSLRTYIYDVPLADSMELVCEKGYAQYFKDSAELARLIADEESDIKSTGFWETNSLNKMIDGIQAELDKQSCAVKGSR